MNTPNRLSHSPTSESTQLDTLVELQKSDPIIQRYNRDMLNGALRSYMGANKYCNDGVWDDSCDSLDTATRNLVARLSTR
jgi:hypothetical protein